MLLPAVIFPIIITVAILIYIGDAIKLKCSKIYKLCLSELKEGERNIWTLLEWLAY